MPRQFSIGALMILIAMFGILFAAMEAISIHPIAFAGTAIFFAGIGAAQMFLFNGQSPRKASFIAGIILGPVIGIATLLIGDTFAGEMLGDIKQRFHLVDVYVFGMGFIVLGGPIGYACGGVIASIFLVHKRKSTKEKDDGEKLTDQNQ